MQVAVICEYNPFHNGHKYQIDEIRRHFGADTAVTAIMGGIFSQRGEPYIAPPYVRAKAALCGGCDLVLELPYPFSASRAADFAAAGVEIAAAIGADVLAFGSECGDIAKLTEVKDRLDSNEIRVRADEILNGDPSLGKTRACSMAYTELFGTPIDAPNDILGIEYLRAIEKTGKKLAPFAVKRVGCYNRPSGEVENGENAFGFASAGEIRRQFAAGGIEAASDISRSTVEILKSAEARGLFPADIEKLFSAYMMSLFCLGEGGGIAARLCRAGAAAKSVAELFGLAATKRYSDADIRRAALYALCNTDSGDCKKPPRYTKLFAANARGREILKTVPCGFILTKPSAVSSLTPSGAAQYRATFTAERAFSLCLGGEYDFLRQTPFMAGKNEH